MKLDLLREYVGEAVVVGEAGEHAAVVERQGAQVAVFVVVGRHVARGGRAAAVPDEHQLATRIMRAARRRRRPAHDFVERHPGAGTIGCLAILQRGRERLGVAVHVGRANAVEHGPFPLFRAVWPETGPWFDHWAGKLCPRRREASSKDATGNTRRGHYFSRSVRYLTTSARVM